RYVWDPTEPVATRPLAFIISTPNAQPATHYYAHDGNKNVSELVDGNGAVTAHYEYAPFGDVTVAAGNLAFSNPFRFSSEYADDALGLVYYNYRHYEPVTGRWGRRDPLSELAARSLYSFAKNSNVLRFDYIGLSDCCECGRCQIRVLNTGDPVITDFIIVSGLGKEYRIQGVPSLVNEIGGKIFGDIQKTANEILEIINRAGSSGRLFQPRIRAGRVIEVERRDCRHSFWFFGSCRWRYWVKDQVMIRSDWSSPDNSENYDNQEIYNWVNPFDMEDAVRIAKELYESAKAIAEKEIGNVGIIESVSKMTGCEIMEGDNE
ncbi:MAG: RHS repeat-associated core domain-containing protein, partial [Kiritimatiellae bacterium]|nr:RHS repeat-associated core domain-containing protein [Kiritimatiellia bacterium]